MSEKKVSIIIPVYNVEEYVEQCLNSIIGQTYKNIEIIIVNDGSTDSSLNICKKFESEDSRVIVVNQTNGGPAKARNKGIEYATGDFLAFIDSDDFVCKDMIEKLVALCIETEAEIACCNYDFYHDNTEVYEGHTMSTTSKGTFEAVEARRLLLFDNYYRCYAWNKLYLRELFSNERFPEGVLYEDIKIMHALFEKANKVSVTNESLYHYRVRKNSITRSTRGKRVYEILYPIKSVLSSTTDEKVISGCIRYYLFFFNDLILSGLWDEAVYKEFLTLFKDNKTNIIKDKDINRVTKCRLFLIYYSYRLYKRLYLAYARIQK